jgi:LDH2 family malate/lactate/ureidoglycolate dehydrogenase
MPLPRLSTVDLRRLGVEIFERSGAPREYAELVVDMLIDASLAGHDSHGILYLTRYAERIRKGIIDPKSKPEVTNDSLSTAIIDGHWAFGQVTAKKTMEVAIEKARKTSISAVGAFHCNHIGRLGAYTLLAAENNMIGILMVNSINPAVQPYGGVSRFLGSNPISVAIPAGEMKPFLLDFATSSVAEGKIWQAATKGEKIPLGWIVNNDGHETDNPHDFSMSTPTVEGNGRLLAFGARDGHKGYCLAILMEILGGILTGAGSILDREAVHPNENGILAIVLDIERFSPVETFKKRMDSLYNTVHKAPVDSRFTYDQVQVPGEIECRNREKGLREGIDIPVPVWEQILSLARELDVDTSFTDAR